MAIQANHKDIVKYPNAIDHTFQEISRTVRFVRTSILQDAAPALPPEISPQGQSNLARVIHIYVPAVYSNNHLRLRSGEIISDIDFHNQLPPAQTWWTGSNAEGQRGIFPSNHVEIIEQYNSRPQSQPLPTQAAAQVDVASALTDASNNLYDSIQRNSNLRDRLDSIRQFNYRMAQYLKKNPNFRVNAGDMEGYVTRHIGFVDACAMNIVQYNNYIGTVIDARQWEALMRALQRNYTQVINMRRTEAPQAGQDQLEEIFGNFRMDEFSENITDVRYV